MGPEAGWAAILEDFRRANRVTACDRVCRENRRVLESFISTAGLDAPRDITAAAVETYLAGLMAAGRSAKTIRNHRAAIGRFCEWARRRGVLAGNPARDVDPPPLADHVPHWLTRRELACCLRLARRHGLACEVAVAAYTGLRLSELRALRWGDVDWTARTLTIRRRKNRRPLVLGLHRFAMRRLDRQRARFPAAIYVFPGGRSRRDGRPGRGQWARDRMRCLDTWCRSLRPLQAAVEKFRLLPPGCVGRGWHLFRHTFATRAFLAGVDIRLVQKWMGHRTLAMTQRYTHVADGYDPEIERL